ncbi:winged helix-turn-helix transcriptional regulator [Streptomyces sp. 900105755]
MTIRSFWMTRREELCPHPRGVRVGARLPRQDGGRHGLVAVRISDKWVSLVVCALAPGPMWYSELARKIAGVSPKMLTQTLRSLERDGILARTVTPSVPVRVDYELTPLGLSLSLLLAGVKDWAETHIEEVHEARERYDAGAES